MIVLGDPGEPPLTITGNLVRLTTAEMMYKPQLWPALALALAQLQAGDGSIAKELAGVDLFGIDDAAFWSIVAADGDHPRGVAPYLDAVRHTFGLSDHFWWVRGYQGAIFGFWPVRGRGAYRGPIRAYGATVPPLVIAVRHDPATPYRGGQRLARDLGARLVTVQGDGHGAIANPCVAKATLAYLTELNVPSPGATCTEPGPFSTATASAARTLSPAAVRLAVHRVQRRRLGALPLPGLVGRAAGQRR